MNFVKKVISVILICLTLSACVNRYDITPIIEQESLLERCEDDSVLPDGTDGKALMNALIDSQKQYAVCATKHDKLIETIKGLEKK